MNIWDRGGRRGKLRGGGGCQDNRSGPGGRARAWHPSVPSKRPSFPFRQQSPLLPRLPPITACRRSLPALRGQRASSKHGTAAKVGKRSDLLRAEQQHHATRTSTTTTTCRISTEPDTSFSLRCTRKRQSVSAWQATEQQKVLKTGQGRELGV